VVERGTVPKEIASTWDCHFTVLGVTAASGKPVLCVVIFASEKESITVSWASGIDIQIDPIYDKDGNIILDTENIGGGMYFQGGPKCCFRGREIPYLPLVSPSGSITAKLQVKFLRWLDEMNVFERKEGGQADHIQF
jgi:hypothetical protein